MNRVIHFEIHAADTDKIARFYRTVFGWQISKWETPGVDYWVVTTGPDGEPGINGGIVKRQGAAPKGGEPVSAFVCTIDVPSVDEYIRKITAAGGSLSIAKMAIPGMAWLAYCQDIEGNIFGILEADKSAK